MAMWKRFAAWTITPMNCEHLTLTLPDSATLLT